MASPETERSVRGDVHVGIDYQSKQLTIQQCASKSDLVQWVVCPYVVASLQDAPTVFAS